MTCSHPSEGVGHPVRIIHLEDNLLDRELVAALLDQQGIVCEITYAENQETFRAALEGIEADLIISDFSLPGYDGGRALELARKTRAKVPFIFFSGTLGEEAAVESLKNGATDYVLKQRPERLMVALHRALQEAAARLMQEKVEHDLREREAMVRNIMENVEDLIAVLDLDGRLILASPSHGRLFTAEALVPGTDFFSHLHPADQERSRAAFRQVIDGRASRHVEYRLLLADGSERTLDAKGSIMIEDEGEDHRVLWVARDITDRRQAEGQISEQAALLDEATDAICVNDLDQRIRFWNRSAERLYGWTSGEAIGKNANELLCQDDVALTALKTLIQRGEWNGELHQVTRSGAQIVVASRWTLIRDEVGGPKSILVINTDITERKKAQQKIQQQAELLDKARDAILLCDSEDRIVYWNDGATRLYGWSEGDVIGRRVEDLLFPHVPAEWAAIRKALNEKGEWIGESRQRSRTGAELVVQSRQTLVRGSAGQEPSVLSINSDITAQKKIEEQFLRTQRMESIGALAGGIAHDLNNVLGPIMMAVDVIRGDPSNAANAGLLDLVGTSAKRGSELVKQILSFARGMDGRRTNLRLPALVGEIVKLAGDTFPRSITIRSEIADDIPPFEADATQIHQVLLNLFVNARDAMPSGGSLTVAVKTVGLSNHRTKFQDQPVSGKFVEITVRDTGTGIPAEALPKIFEPFFTTKDAGKGTGLGLSTVLGIVKGHGGFLEVESSASKGTAFHIYLPLADVAPGTASEGKGKEITQGRNEAVLVVDDEEAILEITRETLNVFNYRVLTSTSGEEAIGIYRQHGADIDLVVTDMAMSGMDGLRLIDLLRKIRPDVRIIAVSGLPPDPHLPASVKGFLKKPYTTKALLGAIRAALDS